MRKQVTSTLSLQNPAHIYRLGKGGEEEDKGETYKSKYAIERASSPIDSSTSMMVLRRISSRKTDGSDGVGPPLGSGRVVVGVGGRSVAQGAFGVEECKMMCRSIPAVAITGSIGWISVVLTIER